MVPPAAPTVSILLLSTRFSALIVTAASSVVIVPARETVVGIDAVNPPSRLKLSAAASPRVAVPVFARTIAPLSVAPPFRTTL